MYSQLKTKKKKDDDNENKIPDFTITLDQLKQTIKSNLDFDLSNDILEVIFYALKIPFVEDTKVDFLLFFKIYYLIYNKVCPKEDEMEPEKEIPGEEQMEEQGEEQGEEQYEGENEEMNEQDNMEGEQEEMAGEANEGVFVYEDSGSGGQQESIGEN